MIGEVHVGVPGDDLVQPSRGLMQIVPPDLEDACELCVGMVYCGAGAEAVVFEDYYVLYARILVRLYETLFVKSERSDKVFGLHEGEGDVVERALYNYVVQTDA